MASAKGTTKLAVAEDGSAAHSGMACEKSGVTPPTAVSTPQVRLEDRTEYANYFCEYAKLYHQKDMLEDQVRMTAYHTAILKNKGCFKDKVVLDVGSGSGILSIWAAQAGAKKVYAVEATGMAAHARALVAANGLASKIEVIQSKVEEIDLPEKVDIIVSEWMGYLLVREAMLDSVLWARDKFLKKGGALYPSHARICWGALRGENGYRQSRHDFNWAMSDWQQFLQATKTDFGVDFSSLTKPFEQENQEYFLQQATFRNLQSEQVVGQNLSTTNLDLNTVTLAELKELREKFTIEIANVAGEGQMTALGCWFETDFQGGPSHPAKTLVTLDTSPHAGSTHWGQQVFFLDRPLRIRNGDKIHCETHIQRHKDNQRMVHCTLGLKFVPRSGDDKPGRPLRKPIQIAPRRFHIQ